MTRDLVDAARHLWRRVPLIVVLFVVFVVVFHAVMWLT